MKNAHRRGRVPFLLALLLGAGAAADLRASDPSLGPEFVVNTYTTNSQAQPAVARAGSGGFVIVWSSVGPDGDGGGIAGRRYSSAGQPLGDEFVVNTVTTGLENEPVVVGAPDGQFLVVWESFATAPSTIAGRRFDANGAPVGAEFTIGSSSDLGNVLDPAVGSVPGSGSLVSWRDVSNGSIRARLLGQTMAPVGSAFTVNVVGPAVRNDPAVGGSVAGYVVAWDVANGDGSGTSVEAVGLTQGGVAVWGPMRVNVATAGDQAFPAVAVDSAGGGVIAWESPDGDLQGIRARRFSSSGPVGDEFLVSAATTGAQRHPTISMSEAGDFVVAWESTTPQTTQTDVYARRFLANGAPANDEARINTFVAYNQFGPRLARTENDALVATWGSFGRDGADFGVSARFGCVNGDVNVSGAVDVNDVFYLINFLFAGGTAPTGCADANGDAKLDVSDVFYLINYLFAGGAPPV
jgi:hypothetical protein